MKRILSYILFILLITLALLTSIKSLYNFKTNVDYRETKQILNTKIDEYVLNEELSKKMQDAVTIQMIKKDISNFSKINQYDTFYKVIDTYDIDDELKEKYATDINDIYIKNIYPVNEFSIIQNKLINVKYINIALIINIVLVLTLTFILIKKDNYLTESYLASSIILSAIYIFIHKYYTLYYTNEYFSKLISNYIKNSNYIILIYIIIFVLVIALSNLIKIRRKTS